MRLDRKLLLIAPAIVLVLVVAGMLYASTQLHLLAKTGSGADRAEFINAVAAGKKPLNDRQAIELLQWQLEVETRRTEAIVASRDLLIELSAIALASCIVLGIGIRGVPREHWPRFGRQRGSDA
ncbi:MAG TPA: hypothetical protein VL383_13030 [Gemmatimonadaceae bacterium]|nr:hypothetical protein [Gemmatimonadaceae bacterium]